MDGEQSTNTNLNGPYYDILKAPNLDLEVSYNRFTWIQTLNFFNIHCITSSFLIVYEMVRSRIRSP